MTSSIERLSKVLPKSEYKKIEDIYNFIYNIYAFIYQVDFELFNDTNFVCNYLIHKQINKDIMYNKLSYGITNIKYVNSLKIYYINIAGINILLENIIIDKTLNTETPYNVNEVIIDDIVNEDYLLENININYIDNYFKIIFYIELFNKNNISYDILLELKKFLQKLLNKDKDKDKNKDKNKI